MSDEALSATANALMDFLQPIIGLREEEVERIEELLNEYVRARISDALDREFKR